MSSLLNQSKDVIGSSKTITATVILSSIVVGLLMTSTFISGYVLLALSACIGIIGFTMFARMRHAVHIGLILVIISVTIHNSRFGIPFKPDAVAVPILALVLVINIGLYLRYYRVIPLLLPVSVYLFAHFIASFINSPVFQSSIRQSLILTSRALTFCVVVLAVQYNYQRRNDYPRYLIWLLLIQTVISLVALSIYSYLPTPFVLVGQDGGTSRSINGFFLEANLYGVFALSVLSIMIPVVLFSEKRRYLTDAIFVIIGLAGIVLSYTRSSWIGLVLVVFCLVIIVLLKPRKRILVLLFGMIALLVLAASVFLYVLFTLEILGFESNLSKRFASIVNQKSGSAVLRTGTWSLALHEWLDHKWIGSGPLSFAAVAPWSRGWLFGSVIQTLHDSGIIGLLSMFWFLGGALIYTWRAFIVADNDDDRGVLLGYLLSQVGLFFVCQFSSFFWGGFPWVLLGLAVGHSTIILHKDDRSWLGSRFS